MISLKTINYNKTKGLTYSNLTYQFTFKNCNEPINIVNTIRRTIISQIPTIAFEPSIMQFIKNTSILNNDQLRERLSQLPILNFDTGVYHINPITDYKKFIQSNEYRNMKNVSIFINAKNTTNNIIPITTNDIKYQIDNKTIDNPYDKKYPIILLKLKKNQEINCSITSAIGIGKQNNIWSPVSKCTLTYEDENTPILSINSQGQLDEFVIFDKAIDNIIFELNLNTNKIKSYISTITKKIETFEITLDNMTIGNALNSQLQDDKRIKFCGVSKPSGLEEFVKIKITLDKEYDIKDIGKILEENNNKLITIYEELKKQNKEEMKKHLK